MTELSFLKKRLDVFLGYQSAATAEDELIRLNEWLVRKKTTKKKRLQKKKKTSKERHEDSGLHGGSKTSTLRRLLWWKDLLVCDVQLEIREAKTRHFKQSIYTNWTFCFLAVQKTERKEKMFEEEKEDCCVVWFYVTVAITISDFLVCFSSQIYSRHPCFLLYYIISEWCCKFMCTVWTYCMCAYGGDVRVSPGRCFIFVMKYIKLTYTQARIMFISFCFFLSPDLMEAMQRRRAEAGGPPCWRWGTAAAQTWQRHV